MKEFKYEPQPLKTDKGTEVPNPFKGHILIQVPKYKERMKLIKELNMNLDAKGEIALSSDNFETASKMYDIADKYVKSLSVKRGKEEFNSIEELEYDQEGSNLILEAANVVLSGIRMGKS